MVRIQSEIKRALLRQIVAGAETTASTVKEAIIAVQAAACDSSFKKGRIIVNTSGNGQSASFAFSANYTQDVLVALTEELINVCDDTVSAGYAADDGTDQDATFAAMVSDDRLIGIRTQQGDFTSLRFPVTR